MATVTVHPTPAMPEQRWVYLLVYLALVIVAEVMIAIPGASSPFDRPFQPIGLSLHILLVFSLMFLSVILQSKDAVLAPLLVAASLASLVRVFSLAVPRYPFFQTPDMNPLRTIPWLALVSIPLLVSIVAVAYVQGLHPLDLGLLITRWKDGLLQLAIALTGIPRGLADFPILRPQPWIERSRSPRYSSRASSFSSRPGSPRNSSSAE